MMRAPIRRPLTSVLGALVLLTGVHLAVPSTAHADETPGVVPPGTEASAPVPEVDPTAPGLKMREGATLAAAKVLPIVSIVESEGGEERREETSTHLKFALQAEVLFGKDSAKLTPEANSRIAAIAEEVKKRNATKIRVFGFTDDLGSEAHGDLLSKQRADAVHGVLSPLLAERNIAYEIRGYGEQYPIADNSTEEGRRKNRRVEVSFPTGG
ncbi:OmpA family protein [Streptomyces sudanensis]|uniref:OmpA family protein n=2 Tax=Streptomyces TaxID=1883 RepID=A0ABY4TBC2_9ACTN|nr:MULTISPECIES: OmpA family protein [Streptomyces]MCQ0001937.1 OmpA family protein [Streptomyces sudanensis]URN15218.1 OmpA family protein [Streptomyces sudanensis]